MAPSGSPPTAGHHTEYLLTMPETFTLLPGARSLAMPDGRTVYADRHGRVTVSREDAAAIRGSAAMRRYDAIVEVAPYRHVPGLDERACACGFSPWPWQADCPRCGSHLPEPPTPGGM